MKFDVPESMQDQKHKGNEQPYDELFKCHVYKSRVVYGEAFSHFEQVKVVWWWGCAFSFEGSDTLSVDNFWFVLGHFKRTH